MFKLTEKSYIIYQLEKMANNLDRTPLHTEFTKIVPHHYIEKHFGTYNKLLEHVGLETNKENVGRKRKS